LSAFSAIRYFRRRRDYDISLVIFDMMQFDFRLFRFSLGAIFALDVLFLHIRRDFRV